MELPNLQVGKTQDRVAAGNPVKITTSNGDIIIARAITPIRNSSVAFQKIEGQGWVAFDPSSPALTSSSKEIRRRRSRKSRIISVPEQYFFKGLVRFLDKQLYKGGDDAIVTIDDSIDVSGILGFANLGTDSLDFIAIYRKQNDLKIDLRGNKSIISDWFSKGYSLWYWWLGSDFYGFNRIRIDRAYNRTEYNNPDSWGATYTVLPRYLVGVESGFAFVYYESTNIEPIPIPDFTATEDGIATTTRSGQTIFPLEGVSAPGPEGKRGTWTYKIKEIISKRMDKNTVRESPIVSTNLGQLAQGTDVYKEDMSIVFNEDFLKEYTEDVYVLENSTEDGFYYILGSQLPVKTGVANYQFSRKVDGTRQGTTTREQLWTVYLSKDNTANCYRRYSSEYGGNLKIVSEYKSDLVEFSTALSGLKPGATVEPIVSRGSHSGSFQQTASSSVSWEETGYIVDLLLSGNQCYIFTELNYSSNLDAVANHKNDTDGFISYSGKNGFSYKFRVEEGYWYYEFGRKFDIYPNTWFLTGVTQSIKRSHPELAYAYVDTVKLKNNRDDLTIEINPDSIALLVDSPSSFAIGQTVSLECFLPYTGLSVYASVYERAMEYSVTYSSDSQSRGSQMSRQITVSQLSDDTLHNQIFNNILDREYDIIWKESDGYYIGNVTILSYQEEDRPYYDYIDGSVLSTHDGSLEYPVGRFKTITSVTVRLGTRQKINASLLEMFNLASGIDFALVVSRDNYYNYIVATNPTGIFNDFIEAKANMIPNLFLRENPIIATPSIPPDGEIESDRTMYAEILELLPDGRWVRREEESGDVTSMNLGSPDNTTDLWSYYKK